MAREVDRTVALWVLRTVFDRPEYSVGSISEQRLNLYRAAVQRNTLHKID